MKGKSDYGDYEINRVNSEQLKIDFGLSKFDETIDKAVDRHITKIWSETGIKPIVTPEERAILKAQVLEALLRKEGATDEDIKAIRKDAEAEAVKIMEKLKEHEEHAKNYKVIEGGANANNINN